MTFQDQLKKYIEDSGETYYRIAKDAGLDESTLGRFMSGQRGLSIESVDKLVEYFGLELKRRRKKRGS